MPYFRPKSQVNDNPAAVHANETYRPSRVLPTAEMAFAHWTERVAAQSPLVAARELSGLSNEQLSALANEFVASPRRKRKDWYRFLPVTGGVVLGAGVLGLLFGNLLGLSQVAVTSAAFLVLGFVMTGLGSIYSFHVVPLESAHGRLGLYVGELNEQHPWLYRTLLLMKHDAAEEYRSKVLEERGPVRGIDFLLMEEIATVHESLELTQNARSVRQRVQSPAGGFSA